MEKIIKLTFEGRQIYVGMDVHKKSWSISIFTEEFEHKTFTQPPDVDTLVNYLKRNFPGASYKTVYAALINFARTTVGIKEGLQGLVMDIQHVLIQLEMLRGFIAAIENEMEITMKRIPYSRKLLSIKGFGIATVSGLIGEICDFTKFTTQSAITKLAGLNLYEVSSGKRRGQRRISKRGRSLLRKILYYAAIQTVRKNGVMYDYYRTLIGRGMKKIMALSPWPGNC